MECVILYGEPDHQIVQAFSVSVRKSIINPLNAKTTKWSNTLKQFVGNLPTNCLSVFDHFVGLALKGLTCPYIA